MDSSMDIDTAGDEKNRGLKRKMRESGDQCQLCSLTNDRRASLFMPTVPSDLLVRIFDEKQQNMKTLNVHRVILSRSIYFKKMMDMQKDAKKIIVLELKSYRFQVYFLYLQYLYTSYLEVSNELMFEIYQLVSDLDSGNEKLLLQLKNSRKQMSLEEMVHFYMLYTSQGMNLYEAYKHKKMQQFFEEYICLTITASKFDAVLQQVEGTPLAAQIAECKKKAQKPLLIDAVPSSTQNDIYSTHDLNNWPLLQKLPSAMLQQIDKFYIFHSGKSLLMITKDDRVYGFGANEFGQLGVGHKSEVPVPEEVIELSGKKLAYLTNGQGYLMALTASGDLYGFGCNNKGQLGVGNTNAQVKPTLVKKGIKMVRCGKDHTVALDMEQSVWNWGNSEPSRYSWSTKGNKVTNRGKVNVDKPAKVRNLNAIYIGCNSECSIAATEDDTLVWGYFGDDDSLQPLFYKTPKTINPYRGEQKGYKAKIISGFEDNGSYLIAVKDNGKGYFVYYWKSFWYEPIHEIDVPIEAVFWPVGCKCAVLVGQGGQLYVMRGNYYNHGVVSIAQTSLADAFAKEGFPNTPTLTHLPQYLLDPARNKLIGSFNDPATSDLTLKVNGELIHLQRSILRQRSTHFSNLLDTEWNGRDSIEIVDQSISHGVYLRFFRQLYTSSHVTDNEDLKTLFGLYSLAKLYQEAKLLNQCENHISHSLSVAAASIGSLDKFDWFKSNLEDVKYHYGLLVTKYVEHFSLKKCVSLYRNNPELRHVLIPFLAEHESELLAKKDKYDFSMNQQERDDLHSKIASYRESKEIEDVSGENIQSEVIFIE